MKKHLGEFDEALAKWDPQGPKLSFLFATLSALGVPRYIPVLMGQAKLDPWDSKGPGKLDSR